MFTRILASLLAFVATISFAAVDVNVATVADLDSIKGIGPSTSGRILEERKASPFKGWSDLMKRVPGIGEKRAAKLSAEGLTVNGEAFKPAASDATDKKAASPAK
ncbi:MAG: helix-hairpin-helix domain-containing protein [Hydrogenophaga sp.]|jgi:competence protein ComEA|uniref:ComEA family DNA-binding protein n=1 Tax=Hydrogenophaga sp. TaxID=1904254 RepID=UPI00261AB905|nr:helix-hairpin-helix domain-containing protein [Hydrogenophaga sp.]MCV0439907.1 helix-hairpin-helix domain-containing protein [Hydrogenophaga sp.]